MSPLGTLLSLILLPHAARAELSILGGLTHENTVEPGQVLEGDIEVKNPGDQPVQARLYQTDYSFFADGRNLYDAPGTTARSNAPWVRLGQDSFVIPPKETVSARYTVRVPTGALSGTFWSMVMIEESGAPPAPGREDKTQIRLGIRHVMRYGLQLVTHLGDSGMRRVRVARHELINREGKRILEVDIENTGERWLVPEIYIEIFDGRGRRIGRWQGVKKRVFPGTSIRQSIELQDAPKGRHKGMIVIDDGGEHVFGSRVDLEL